MEDFDISLTKQLVMAGDFNLFFNSKLEAQGGNPTLKKEIFSQTHWIKRDLWSMWYMESKKYEI